MKAATVGVRSGWVGEAEGAEHGGGHAIVAGAEHGGLLDVDGVPLGALEPLVNGPGGMVPETHAAR